MTTKFMAKLKQWATANLKTLQVPTKYSEYFNQRYKGQFQHNNRDMFFLWNYNFRYGFFGTLKVKFFKRILKAVDRYENKITIIPITDKTVDEEFNVVGKK